jgi:hypothetical protein
MPPIKISKELMELIKESYPTNGVGEIKKGFLYLIDQSNLTQTEVERRIIDSINDGILDYEHVAKKVRS